MNANERRTPLSVSLDGLAAIPAPEPVSEELAKLDKAPELLQESTPIHYRTLPTAPDARNPEKEPA